MRFLNPENHLPAAAELERYRTHRNDVHDAGYQNFVRPLYDLIKNSVKSDAKALDFGCGAGPVLTHLLNHDGYKVELYDPLFAPNKQALNEKYALIFATEVVEHFNIPDRDFALLRSLLSTGGDLFLMTLIYKPAIDFDSWWYRKDPTHVSFYSEATLNWIMDNYGFRTCEIHGKNIVWLKV